MGGRTETVLHQGETFDIGAQVSHRVLFLYCNQWIAPDTLQPRINKLLKELGLHSRPQYTEGKGILKFGNKVTEYEGEGKIQLDSVTLSNLCWHSL